MNYLKTIIALLSILIVLLGVYIQMPEKNCSTGNTRKPRRNVGLIIGIF